jgi:hypothetical protein
LCAVIDRAYSKQAKTKVLHDRIAFVTAVVGAAFMMVAIWTRVNPVEGSVVRPEFLHTAMGQPIAMLLLIASLPGWIGIILAGSIGLPIEPEAALLSSSSLHRFSFTGFSEKSFRLAGGSEGAGETATSAN